MRTCCFIFLAAKSSNFRSASPSSMGASTALRARAAPRRCILPSRPFSCPQGSEVIVAPINDMGGVIGIIYQGLIPVFADVDPETLNIDPASVRRSITPRTRAIVAVHLGGLAADMDALLAIGREAGIPVVEGCAQAFMCEYKGRLAGIMGTIASFSLNHFKHVDCGSGEMVLTDDDAMRDNAGESSFAANWSSALGVEPKLMESDRKDSRPEPYWICCGRGRRSACPAIEDAGSRKIIDPSKYRMRRCYAEMKHAARAECVLARRLSSVLDSFRREGPGRIFSNPFVPGNYAPRMAMVFGQAAAP